MKRTERILNFESRRTYYMREHENFVGSDDCPIRTTARRLFRPQVAFSIPPTVFRSSVHQIFSSQLQNLERGRWYRFAEIQVRSLASLVQHRLTWAQRVSQFKENYKMYGFWETVYIMGL